MRGHKKDYGALACIAGHSRYSERSVRYRDLEDALDFEPMRHRVTISKKNAFRDYLNPLMRFLRSQVGRPVNEAHSKLCEGSRGVHRTHVMTHFHDMTYAYLTADGYLVTRWGWLQHIYQGFYRDANGILREFPQKKWRHTKLRYEKKKKLRKLNAQEGRAEFLSLIAAAKNENGT